MTRIEKTQLNFSAMINMSSTLKEIQSDKVIEIVDDGKRVVVRPKSESEKENFRINLDFLDHLFQAIVRGSRNPLVVTEEAEEYFRNCSWACQYYRGIPENLSYPDLFNLFHRIHFTKIDQDNFENEFLELFLGIYRIFPDQVMSFVECHSEETKIDLGEPKAFNEVFNTLLIHRQGEHQVLFLESGELDMTKSIDALFSAKDLLNGIGVDASAIPEMGLFGTTADGELRFEFTLPAGLHLELSFRYKKFTATLKKTCA